MTHPARTPVLLLLCLCCCDQSIFLGRLPEVSRPGDGGQSADAAADLTPHGPLHFAAPRSYGVGFQPVALAVAPFGRQGHQDLIVTGPAAGKVLVLSGTGDGTFRTGSSQATETGTFAIAAADFSGDGLLDVAVLGSTGNIGVLLGRGDGSFQPIKSYPAGTSPSSLVAANLSGGNLADLATSDKDSNHVSVLLSHNGFDGVTPSAYPVDTAPAAIAAGEIDGAPGLDLVTANQNTISILRNRGDGRFQPADTYFLLGNTTGLALGDFSHRGLSDLALSSGFSSELYVYFNSGSGAFDPKISFTRAVVGNGPRGLFAFDLDGDGRDDLVCANSLDDTVSVLLSTGTRDFQQARTFPAGREPWGVVVKDVNGDGRPDLVVVNRAGGGVSVLLRD